MDERGGGLSHRVTALLVCGVVAHHAQHVLERHLALAGSFKRLFGRLRFRARLSACSWSASAVCAHDNLLNDNQFISA
jgi:hypothetical protein